MRITVLLCLTVLTAQAQKPELVLPAIHSTPIMDVCFSADNHFMASCAGNEIKLWEQKTGRLIKTILTHLPVAQIALSKDGTKLALATFCGASEFQQDDGVVPNINTEVQVWDMVSGKMLRTLKALGKPIRIHGVEISENGQFVLAHFNAKITCWDALSGAEKFQLEMSGRPRLRFSPDGSHFLLDSQDKALFWVVTETGAKETILEDVCLGFTCNGDFVQVLTKSGTLKRWNWRNKTFSPDLKIAFEEFYDESFNQDFRFSNNGEQLGALYQHDGQLFYNKVNTQTGEVLAKQKWPNDGLNWFFISPDLQNRFEVPIVDVADVRAGMTAYSLVTGQFAYSFGLKMLEATTNANMFPPDFRVYNEGKMILVKRDSSQLPMPNALFLPERGEIICGVEMDSVSRFAENGTLKEDKRWRLVCKDRISYELSDVKTGQLVATLLLADTWAGYTETDYKTSISRIWAVTTPSGLFDASPEMMENLHYSLGMEVIELGQLKSRYYEPYLLQKIMGIMPGGLRPVDELNNVPLYPEVLEASIKDDLLKVRLKPRSGGIGKVALELDGSELVPDANPARQADFQLDLKPYLGYFSPTKPNHLSLKLYNEKGWLESQSYKLEHTYDGVSPKDGGDTAPARRGLNTQSDAILEKIHFYALVVGTSKYRDEKLNLKYPEKDAAIFADALRKSAGKLFKERVSVKLLSTASEPWPRKAEIRKALQEFGAKAGPDDILLVYFSGHGITYPPVSEAGQFYYLTTDIQGDNLQDEAILKTQAVAQDSLMEWVRQVKARKRILIYDACNSGSVVSHFEAGAKDLNTDQRRALERMKDRTGMYVLAGSAADKSSYEASNYGHGLLTYSLINGMLSVAAKRNNLVELGDLFAFVEDDVERLAKNINREQRPEVIKAESYAIGIIDRNTDIKMPTELPVFVRVTMIDGKKNKDLIGLSKALNSELERISSEKTPAMVFWDVESYAGKYYYLGGQYQSEEGKVTGNASLYLNDTELKRFPFSGTANSLSQLAKDLIFEVQSHLLKINDK